MAGNNKVIQNINEVILRLLGLEDTFDLDYETYYQLLRETLIKATSSKQKIPSEEFLLLKEELKKVKSKSGRFVIKKQKINKKNISSLNIANQQQLKVNKEKFLLPPGKIDSPKEIEEKSKISKKNKTEDILLRISKTLDSILKTLIEQNKTFKKSIESERKSKESRKRLDRENELEAKPLDAVKGAIQKITKPFQSIIDTIINFLANVILGKIVIKLLDWISKEENQKKLKSIIRFFKDWWPVLLAAYLRFGTGIGRLVGSLTSILIRGSIKLLAATARLLAASKLKGFGRASRFLNGRGGQALSTGLELGANVAGTIALSSAIKNFAEPSSTSTTPNQKVKVAGGGRIFNGMVRGKRGIDKIPAMLSDGEFVMSAGTVKKYGVDTLEAMNAAGGGTNLPKIFDDITYAAGGGLVGNSPDFWKIAALASKEDSLNPQGQADVAQALYNRAAIGSYPGGKSIGSIITAPGQFEPTFKNPAAWKSIKDKKTAIAAAGNVQKIDMAVKSITNPVLQRESQKFIGGRTDFMGESQKPNMKPGDITRGRGYNFHGWFYNAKLKKAAPIPNIVSSNAAQQSTKQPTKQQPNLVDRIKSFVMPQQKQKESGQSSGRMANSSLISPSFYEKDVPKAAGGISGFIPFGGAFGRGGEVKESTGQYYRGGGEDRRNVNLRLKPGEAFKVFTDEFVAKGGMNMVEYLESLMDSNSNANKKNVRPPVNKAKIAKNTSPKETPSSIPSTVAKRSSPKIIVLNQPMGNNNQISKLATSTAPSFSPIHPKANNSVAPSTYGIMV